VGRVRAWAAAVVAVAGAFALVGCAAGPDPRDEAERLAADLADGTFDTATMSNGEEADDALAAVLGNLATLSRTVEVGAVEEGDGGGDTRDAALTWTWDLGEGVEPWTVETSAQLERVEDGWVTRWSPALVHQEASDTSSLRMVRTDAERGEILDEDGTAIVTTRPVFRIGVDKATVPDRLTPQAVAEDLARRLEFEDPAAYGQRVANASESAFVVAITVRESEADRWNVDELRTIPGVLVQAGELPLAPTSTFARPILGSVGEATAEIIEESEGAVVQGDQVGLSGLQRAYDSRLRGVPGTTVSLTTGEAGEEVHRTEPVAGEDLVITLDTSLQTVAEALLAEVESASAIVAVRPSDGHVLAAASGPGSNGQNTATVGRYPPGSTFKIATALALLRQGLTPDSPVDCSPTIPVEGREFRNYPGYPASSLGRIALREAIAQSCNTAFLSQRDTVTAEDVATAAESLGIGTTGTWPFPYASGDVPDDVTGTEHAAGLIGQGKVLASPLAMSVAAASVAQGSTVTPVLVVDEEADADAPREPLTEDEAADLQDMMREVVESGTSTFLRDVPGEPVAAKSGTAQFGTAEPPETHAWMIAFQGDFAVAVFVEVGDFGTATAGPILEEFLLGASG
jgi:cell division protein FtsI/penicillin-binding protein 2